MCHIEQVVRWAWQGMGTHSSAGAGMFSMSFAVVLFEAGAALPLAAAWLPFARAPPLAAAWGALKSLTAMYSSLILQAIFVFWLQQRMQVFSKQREQGLKATTDRIGVVPQY